MTRGPRRPLQEGQELIGILEIEADLLDVDHESEPEIAAATGKEAPAGAPWDQLIAAVDRDFLPDEAARSRTISRFRGR